MQSMVLFTNSIALSVISLSGIVLADSVFDWRTLAATTTLNWTACYSGFECSRLIVPLDYASPTSANATIAITRYPANCSKSEYLGPVLLNPGGPGGSGVDYVVEVGADVATILGDCFDIVGFDPRGVIYSTPMVSWFKTDVERTLWMPATLNTVYPSLNESSGALAEQWARAQIQGELAAERDENYMKYITTDNTARDMLRITEAFGRDKLQYWGISYGSVLGSTFASMFPDKVGRIAIDGVLDMEAWYSGNMTREQVDTDKALQIFIDACFAAGPDNCAYYAPSTGEISENLNELLDSVKNQPVPVITPISYTVFGYTLLKNAIFDALYSPSQLFAPLAQGLADLAKRNASSIYTAFVEVPPFECESDSNSSLPFHDNGYEAAATIACGDGPPVNDSVSQLQGFYSVGQEVSSFSDLWSNWRIVCSCAFYITCTFSIETDCLWKWLEATSSGPLRPFGAPNTSFPLLVIGNTVDPVTPISGANSTVALFPGSVLLTLDTVAHTSVNAPSTCVYGYLGQYFRNGTLPPGGTVCSPDDPLFPSNNAGNSADVLQRDVERPSELLRAGGAIGKAYRRITRRKARIAL
ncbi:hypothetical protein B0H19DRAFT_1263146 [Mycena capillaripes]|nr:hypothetical protein B0H19DRAFT_1263146 [Mycena capillaripes]